MITTRELRRFAWGCAIMMASGIAALVSQSIRESRLGIASNGNEWLIIVGGIIVGFAVILGDWRGMMRRICGSFAPQRKAHYHREHVVSVGGRMFIEKGRHRA